MRDRLPLALRFYRLASMAAAPALAPRLLAWRLKPRQGESGAPRRAVRRGKPAAPDRSADLGPRRQRRRNALRHSPDRASAREEFRRAHDVWHRHLRRACRAALARRRPPPIHSARRTAICRPLPRSLAARSGAVRRIRPVAQSHCGLRGPRDPDDPGQRPGVGTLVSGRWRLLPRAMRRCCRALRSLPGAVERRRGTLCARSARRVSAASATSSSTSPLRRPMRRP